jgi:hypothetical protein
MTRHRKPALLAGAAVAAALTPAAAFAGDPTVSDCIAANESSIQLRSEHKLLESRAQSLVCASDACPAEIRAACRKRVDDVNAAMPTIVFEAKDASGNDLSAVRVTMDGHPLVERLEGTSISLDPGEHVFTFTAEGQAPVEKRFVILEGAKERHERVQIGTPPSVASPLAPAGPLATAAEPPPPPLSREEPTLAPAGGGTDLRTIGLVVGGVGVAGLAVGGVLGLLAISAKNDYEAHCGANVGQASGVCDPQGISGHSDASSKAALSTGFVVGGAVLAAAGGALFVFAPHVGAGPAVGIGPGTAVLKGWF